MEYLSASDEAKRLMTICDNQAERVMAVLERQFAVLHNRAQVLLTLCGVLVTVTGFSGRIIAGTNRLSQGLIISGLSLGLLAALVVVVGVLPLRWLMQQPAELLEPWLVQCLRYRNRKTRFYRVAICLLLVGLALYVGAISVMLSDPTAGALPMAR